MKTRNILALSAAVIGLTALDGCSDRHVYTDRVDINKRAYGTSTCEYIENQGFCRRQYNQRVIEGKCFFNSLYDNFITGASYYDINCDGKVDMIWKGERYYARTYDGAEELVLSSEDYGQIFNLFQGRPDRTLLQDDELNAVIKNLFEIADKVFTTSKKELGVE